MNVQKRLKKEVVIAGRSLKIQIPEDTFYDVQDGNTRQMKVDVKQENGTPLRVSLVNCIKHSCSSLIVSFLRYLGLCMIPTSTLSLHCALMKTELEDTSSTLWQPIPEDKVSLTNWKLLSGNFQEPDVSIINSVLNLPSKTF